MWQFETVFLKESSENGRVRYEFLTSLHEASSFLQQFEGHVVVADKLLEAHQVETPAAEVEVGRETEDDDSDREVDVESVRYDRDDIHVTHDLKSG